jgi:Ca2+-binding RTX toxin-like protein
MMTTRMQIEPLERRRLLDAVIADGVVTVTGTQQSDAITFDTVPHYTTGNSTQYQMRVRVGYKGDVHYFLFNGIKRIEVFGLGGDDRIEVPAEFVITRLHPLPSGRVTRTHAQPIPTMLEGSRGNDTLVGGDARDTLIGGRGADVIYGRAGDDHLSGGPDRDRLDAGAGNDLVEGNDGHDRLVGGEGIDRLLGGAGRDRADNDSDDRATIVELLDLA